LDENEPIPTRLRHYLGARVTVYYENTYTDQGNVAYLDDHWLELTKDNGERLLIPTSAVRLIKLLEASKQHGDADILLRPVEGPPQIAAKRGRDE
jgi:hypothetical protein